MACAMMTIAGDTEESMITTGQAIIVAWAQLLRFPATVSIPATVVG